MTASCLLQKARARLETFNAGKDRSDQWENPEMPAGKCINDGGDSK